MICKSQNKQSKRFGEHLVFDY